MDMRKKKKTVKAWGYYNADSGNLGVQYRRDCDQDGKLRKQFDLCMTRAEARMRGCDKPHWKIVRVTITVESP